MKPGKGGKAAPAPRRHPRHTGKGKARCPLGDVLDLSAGGMRIGCPGKPPLKAGSAATVSLKTSAGAETLNVRCCWVRRSGFFGKWQIGLKFIGITEEQAERLSIIAEYGFIPEHKQPKKPDAAAGVENEADATDSERQGEASSDAGGSGAMPKVDLELAKYFESLGLEPTADASSIRDAYRKLVRTCHPDVTQEPEARAKFLEIQQAYDVLRTRRRDQRAA